MSDTPSSRRPPRILIVDDNAAIHADFRKILQPEGLNRAQLSNLEAALFGGDTRGSTPARNTEPAAFRLDSAFQGQEALDLARKALEEEDPYALAFVDVRMPPGWDGVETLQRLWQCSPELQAVICTAYSDYTWTDLTQKLGHTDNLLLLKKPFDTAEVLQTAHALTRKWALAQQARLRVEDLDRMVRERTEKLAQEMDERLRLEAQLRQAQKMEAVGCLAAGIAHEFNNLLTVIQGHASLLKNMPVNGSGAADSVERISQAGDRAASLTRRLLAFSRKQALHFKPLQLSQVVQSMQKLLGQLLGELHSLQLDCAPALPPIHADEGSIEQVLINLALNARDAMPDGGVIRVATRLVTLNEEDIRQNLNARSGRFISLTVSDTGCGMSPEVLSRIFDPFFTTKAVGKGTGLGLSTVLGIVQQHHGWVEVESQPKQGSTFKIFLPACETASASMPSQTVACSDSAPRGAGETILLVEDELSVRTLARLTLEHGGYRVFEAADGPQAIEVWEQSPVRINLLLTDLVMPRGLTGGQLAKALQARDPHLRTLYTSGYSSEVIHEDRLLVQSSNFLAKPYDTNALLKTVRRTLEL